MLKVDMYVKIVLTVIAISLIGLLVKPIFNQETRAQMSTGTGMGKYTVVMSTNGTIVRLNTVTGQSWLEGALFWFPITGGQSAAEQKKKLKAVLDAIGK